MKYREYLNVQSQLESLYEFHPDFFDMLEDTEKHSLQVGFLYDTDDENFPKLLRDYFDNKITGDVALQTAMLNAAQRIYTFSGSGDLAETMRDDTSFPSIAD